MRLNNPMKFIILTFTGLKSLEELFDLGYEEYFSAIIIVSSNGRN